MKKLLVAVAILAFSHVVQGSRCYMHYSVNQGLSNSNVLAIAQDREGFMWFGTKDGLNRFDGYSMQVYRVSDYIKEEQKLSSSNYIRCMLEQPDRSEIWVGTETGIYIFDTQSMKFHPLSSITKNGESINGVVCSMVEDHSGNIWVGVSGKAIYRYIKKDKTLKHYAKAKPGKPLRGTAYTTNTWSLCVDDNNTVWGATFKGGICSYLPSEDRFVFHEIDIKEYIKVSSVLYDKHEQCLWIGTLSDGLYQYDIKSGKSKKINVQVGEQEIDMMLSLLKISPHEVLIGSKNGLLCCNSITSICKPFDSQFKSSELNMQTITSSHIDREGGIWLGTEYDGIYYLRPQREAFRLYNTFTSSTPYFKSKAISRFAQRPDGNIWVASHNCGISIFDVKSHALSPFPLSSVMRDANCLLDDGQTLWIGYINGGVVRVDYKNGNKVNYYTHEGNKSNHVAHNAIFSMMQARDKTIYIGTQYGIYRYNKESDNLDWIDWSRTTQINDIAEDKMGRLWFATRSTGIICYYPTSGKRVSYRSSSKANSLPNNYVTCVYEDHLGNIWAGTFGGGLCKLNEATQTFERFNSSNGILGDIIFDITEDQLGNIWAGTNKALLQISPQRRISAYDYYSGMQGNQFSCLFFDKDKNALYAGGIDGFNVIFPDRLLPNKISPNILLSSIYIDNKKMTADELNITKKGLDVRASSNSIGFDLAAASYVSPSHNKYAYYMENFDEKWIYTEGQTHVSYNLPPGKYVLHVKASNNDGVWAKNDYLLPICVHPPFLRSWPMKILYLLVIGGFIAASIVRKKRNDERKQNLEKLRYEISKEKELYNSKIRFFVNIAHDIRIPLSLIKAPIEMALKQVETMPVLKKNLETVQRNSERLHTLVNQIMDFNKIGMDEFYFNFAMNDICQPIEQTCAQFNYSFSLRQIKFETHIPDQPIMCWIDREAIVKVVYNLLSNAMKYTNDYISLRLSSTDTLIRFEVSNNGEPITAEFQKRVFLPFYQIRRNNTNNNEGGTGIGLTIVKHIIEKHNGNIAITNTVDNQTVFTIEIPRIVKSQDNETEEEEEPIESDSSHQKSHVEVDRNSRTAAILVVEDEIELQNFIVECLSNTYTVLHARNGIEAIEVLKEHKIDLIITDVMMDGMDGIELCSKVREEMLWCHIPVIMLTAKTDLASKMEGVSQGADLYIEKPFSMDLLSAHIAGILNNRKLIRQLFTESIFMPPQSTASNIDDMKFLEELNRHIEENIDKSEGLIELLSEQMLMSRSNLHKKIKSLSGMTPNDYIQLIRLKKAAMLLETTNYRINEVSFMTGFNTPSYFSKCFYSAFGVLPSNFKSAEREDVIN